MRNRIKIPVIFFITVFLAGALFLHSFAKDMEECYHCGRTGQFNCPSCGNTGEVVCDGCGGAGSWVCTGEEGKGKCDNGYYVCPSCNGDGLSRPIPVDGNATERAAEYAIAAAAPERQNVRTATVSLRGR